MPERILVTGFGPFAEHESNASGLAAAALDGVTLPAEEGDPWVLSALSLPVQFERAQALLAEALEAQDVAAAFACGIHGEPGGPYRLEVMAKNERHYEVPDVDGNLVLDARVLDEGPAQAFSTAPVASIKLALEAEGFDAELSDDAGRYLCNAVFYWLAQHAPVAGFLHVPPDASVEQVGRALRLSCEAIARRLESQRVDALA